MRRTASEIIRNLEIRVARLEGRTAAPRGMRNLDALRYEEIGAGTAADMVFEDADSVREWLESDRGFDLLEQDYLRSRKTLSAVADASDHTITMEVYSDGKEYAYRTNKKVAQPYKGVFKIRLNDDGSFDVASQSYTDITEKQYAQAMRGFRQVSVTMI